MDSYSYRLVCDLVLLLLLSVIFNTASCKVVYVFPSEDVSCYAEESCLTLSQLAKNTTDYIGSNTTLFIVGGSHDLNVQLSISNAELFSMQSLNDSTASSVISCSNSSTGFVFTNSDHVYIQGITVIGCNGNIIRSVSRLNIVNSKFCQTFGTPLTIKDSGVNLELTSFMDNSMGTPRNLRSWPKAFGQVNRQESIGGALIVTNSTLTINSCLFVENKANIGGAIFLETEGTIIVRNSVFTSNHATSCDNKLCFGGVLFFSGTSSSFSIENCTFQNNTSGRYGGVIGGYQTNHVMDIFQNYNRGDIAPKIEACTFKNNEAEFGGVIYLYESSISFINNCTFHCNRAEKNGGVFVIQQNSLIEIYDSNLKSNEAVKDGGIFFVEHGSTLELNNCMLTENIAEDNGGVASIEKNSAIFIGNNCTFTNNSAKDNGGVLYLQMKSFAIIETSDFISNRADHYGGVVALLHDSGITIDHSNFANNSAKFEAGVLQARYKCSVNISNSSFNHSSALNYAGAVHIKWNSTAVINTCTFNKNTASDGAALNVYCKCSVSIYSSIFTDNIAEILGGALSSKYDSNVNITNTTFSKNTAHDLGAVLYSEGRVITTIQSSVFVHNSGRYGGVVSATRNCSTFVSLSTFKYNSASTDGGCLYSRSKSNTSISNTLFLNNTAKNNGILLASDKSVIHIENNELIGNVVGHDGAVFYVHDRSKVDISGCNFSSNRANNSGGVVYVRKYSNISIINSNVCNCMAENSGGVICGQDESFVRIEASNFTGNGADYGGMARLYIRSNLSVINCSFSKNHVVLGGGVIALYKHSSAAIQYSMFTFNSAGYGGILIAYPNTAAVFTNSYGYDNTAKSGGVVQVLQRSKIDVIQSNFSHNTAELGGVICTHEGNVSLEDCILENNHAIMDGGAVYTKDHSILSLKAVMFYNNTAKHKGGAVYLLDGRNTIVISCSFSKNRANSSGGVIQGLNSYLTIHNSNFSFSNASKSGGVVHAMGSTVDIKSSQFVFSTAAENGGILSAVSASFVKVSRSRFISSTANINGGALYISESSSSVIVESIFQGNKAKLLGGAIALTDNATVTISGANFTENRAQKGAGFACMKKSSISFSYYESGELNGNATVDLISNSIIKVDKNNASNVGGGLYLEESRIIFSMNTIIESNSARATTDGQGGGVYALNSSIEFRNHIVVAIKSNKAVRGGGISLARSKLYHQGRERTSIILKENRGFHGAAVYVEDYGSVACSNDPFSRKYINMSECFFQTMTKTLAILFYKNIHDGLSRSRIGRNLYGGLLDRCTVVSAANNSMLEQNGITRFKEITNIRKLGLDSISSKPVRICLCRQNKPDCSRNSHSISVKQGNKFTFQLTAVDQVNNSVVATVRSNIKNLILPASQTVRRLESNCSTLVYHVFFNKVPTKHNLSIYADSGPCKDKGLSKFIVEIEVEPCLCKRGFMQEQVTTKCSCICDKMDEIFSKYIKECDFSVNSVIRKGDFWITYLDSFDNTSSPYFIFPYCPLGYCKSPSEKVLINLNLPNGSDTQCASNRHGILCGSCKFGHSLSLGSSNCVKCPENWHKLLVAIVFGAFFAGIVLVFLLLVLNLTVAVGTINSIVFYANIIYANRNLFFSHWQLQLTFVPVFISWLNMDIGFDACFYEGMDVYIKTWLQLAFPAYLFFLVIVIIIITSYSSQFTNLIGKRDPVATLATLILLSYTKLLETIISSLSLVRLNFPNGTSTFNWFPDATLEYGNWKIIILMCVAVIILILGFLYTILILSWQWLVHFSRTKLFGWTRNQKLHTFIDTYNAPYTAKHRYWTGLLLLVRAVVYLIPAFTIPFNPRITLISTAVIMSSLLLYKTLLVIRVYKNKLLNVMESFAFFNIANFLFITWYNFDQPSKANKELLQMIAAYTSVGTMLALFLLVILYHLYRFGNGKVYDFCQNTKMIMKIKRRLLSSNKSHDDLTLIDGNSYRLFDAMDNARDIDDLSYNSPKFQKRSGPTRSSVSLISCEKTISSSMSPSSHDSEV